MHPEVKLCLLILLYAEKNYKVYKYSLYFINIWIVTKLYIWVNQQETLLINIIKGSSETKRNNILCIFIILYYKYLSFIRKFHINFYLNINKISTHIPNKYKPLNDNQLGYYLAGLIDGNGYFDNQNGNLIITYHFKDISAAYWLKDQIKYGRVSKNKKVIKFIISHSNGLLYILELINGKLKTNYKYNQIINNLLYKNKLVSNNFYSKYKNFTLGNINDFDNHWLTGFIDSNGLFKINILNCKTISEIKLKLQITHKNKDLLDSIKSFILNNSSLLDTNKICYLSTGINKDDNIIYYLETISYDAFKIIINYIDKYPLISYKYLNYLYLRKTYLLIQDKLYLTSEDIKKIKDFKEKIKNDK